MVLVAYSRIIPALTSLMAEPQVEILFEYLVVINFRGGCFLPPPSSWVWGWAEKSLLVWSNFSSIPLAVVDLRMAIWEIRYVGKTSVVYTRLIVAMKMNFWQLEVKYLKKYFWVSLHFALASADCCFDSNPDNFMFYLKNRIFKSFYLYSS